MVTWHELGWGFTMGQGGCKEVVLSVEQSLVWGCNGVVLLVEHMPL